LTQVHAEPEQFSMTRIDATGRAIATDDFALDLGSFSSPAAQLLALTDAARLVYRRGSDAGLSSLGFDVSGERVPADDADLVAGPVIPMSGLDAPVFVATAMGNDTWIVWQRPRPLDGPFVVDLMLAGFRSDGAPVGTPVVLADGADARLLSAANLSASATRLVATWRARSDFASPDVTRYVVTNNAGTVLADKSVNDSLSLRPTLHGDEVYLCWVVGIPGAVSAVRLDTAFDPVPSNSGAFSDQVVSPLWAGPVFADGDDLCNANELRLTLVGATAERRWSWETNSQPLAALFDVVLPANGAPSTATQAQRIARFEISEFSLGPSVVFTDRVLTLGRMESGETGVVMSWRPN
jgi:hypothetical protein